MSPLVQIEVLVSDLDRSLAFYRDVFHWHEVAAEMHDYKVLDTPPEWGFGISLRPLGGEQFGPSRLVLYFAVPDPEKTSALAAEKGGKRLFGPRTLPSYGEIWQIEDPDGQRWGLFRAANA